MLTEIPSFEPPPELVCAMRTRTPATFIRVLRTLEALGEQKRRVGERDAELARLEKCKGAAVQDEDYDRAEELRAQAEALRVRPPEDGVGASLVKVSLRRCGLTGPSIKKARRRPPAPPTNIDPRRL